MHVWIDRLAFIISALALTFINAPASAAPVGLKAGTYSCVTMGNFTPRQPSRDSLEEIARAQAGNNIRPIRAPQLTFSPAIFGDVMLDGKGNYRATEDSFGAGKYGFDAVKGELRFTGFLGALTQGEYDGEGKSFQVAYKDLGFHCGLAASTNLSQAPVAKPQPAVQPQNNNLGSALKTATAADYGGKFIGTYVCSQGKTPMVLALRAQPNGQLIAVFGFGGPQNPDISDPLGIYSLLGTWKGSHFKLEAHEWMKKPEGFEMISFEGDVMQRGVFGKILRSSCSTFEAAKAG